MAHGYNNFMNNKDFHPANYTNQRRVSAEMYEWSHVVSRTEPDSLGKRPREWLRENRSHASMQVRVSTAFIDRVVDRLMKVLTEIHYGFRNTIEPKLSRHLALSATAREH